MKTLYRLMVPDFASMVTDLMERHGLTEREVSDRLNVVHMGGSLLRHYKAGGLPNWARGDALIALWLDVTNQAEDQMPMTRWSPPYRVEMNAEAVLVPKCPTCGQSMRGQRLESWKQLQIHHEQHGDDAVMPSWLAPKP